MNTFKKTGVALAAALSLCGAAAASSGAAIVYHPNESSFAENSGMTLRACDGDAGDGNRVRAWFWHTTGGVQEASPWWAGPSGGCTGFYAPPVAWSALRVCVENEGCSLWVART